MGFVDFTGIQQRTIVLVSERSNGVGFDSYHEIPEVIIEFNTHQKPMICIELIYGDTKEITTLIFVSGVITEIQKI